MEKQNDNDISSPEEIKKKINKKRKRKQKGYRR